MAAGPSVIHSGPQRTGWTPSAPKPLTLLQVRGVRRADTQTGSPAYYLPVWFHQEAAPVRGVKGRRGRGQELLPWLRELAASCHPMPSSGFLPLSFRPSELGGRKVPWGVGVRIPVRCCQASPLLNAPQLLRSECAKFSCQDDDWQNENQIDHPRISLLESSCHNMCIVIPP